MFKKVLSIMAALVFACTCMNFTALAVENDTADVLYAAPENFCGSDETTSVESLRRANVITGVGLNAWNINDAISSSTGYVNDKLLARGSNNNRGTNPASVMVYCSNETAYTAYMQSYGSLSGPRYNKLRINGGKWLEATSAEEIPSANNWFWTSVSGITLNVGWNSVEIVGDVLNLRCTGVVFVPQGEEFAFPKSADDVIVINGEVAKNIKDITYPVFNGELTAEATSNSITISGFKASDTNNGNMQKDIAEYRVFYKTADAENYTMEIIQDKESTEYVINNLLSNTDYSIRIEAVDVFGQYVSQEISSKTNEAAALPQFPENAKISYTVDSTMNISWPAASLETGAISRYRVIIDGAVTDEIISDENQRVYTYAIKDLIPNTDYKIQIAAISENGDAVALPEITANSGDLYTVNINHSNFETKGSWITQNDAGTLNSTGESFYNNGVGTDAENPAAGKFYVPKDGTYYIYANPKSGTGVSYADSRCFTMKIDGIQTTREQENQSWGVFAFKEGKPFAFNWESSDPIQLNKGMHSIELFMGNYSKVDSIIITQRQLTLEKLPLNKDAYKTDLEIYEDNKNPSITTPVSATVDGISVKLAWSAEDENLAAYEIFRDDESIAILDSSIQEYTVESLTNGEHAFTVKAYDIAGNSAITVSNAVTIEKEGIEVKAYNIDEVDNTVSYTVVNYDLSCDAVCISALYNSNNKMLTCSVSNVTLESRKEMDISQTLEYTGETSGCRIVTYIWDINQCPLIGRISTDI